MVLEEREQAKQVGKKKIDWHAFQKWEREAEIREAKSLAGLMVKKTGRNRNVGQEIGICLRPMMSPQLPPFLLNTWTLLQQQHKKTLKGKGKVCTLACQPSLTPKETKTNIASAKKSSPIAASFRPEIHNTKQREGESAADYRTRMESVFAAHSGINPDNMSYSDLLKTAVVNGLHPELKNRVMTTCIGWETAPIVVVWTHVLHAERNKVELESKHTKKLQVAQLMFYQQGGPQKPRPRGQPPGRQLHQRGRGRRRPGLQPAAPFPNRTDITVRCYQCGGYGHISRDCLTPVTDQQGGGEQENSWPHAPLHRLSVYAPGLPVTQP